MTSVYIPYNASFSNSLLCGTRIADVIFFGGELHVPTKLAAVFAILVFHLSTFLPAWAQQTATQLLVGQTFVNAVPTGFWVGIERGFFKKYGLDIKIIQFRGNAIGTQALLSGAIPILMAGRLTRPWLRGPQGLIW